MFALELQEIMIYLWLKMTKYFHTTKDRYVSVSTIHHVTTASLQNNQIKSEDVDSAAVG